MNPQTQDRQSETRSDGLLDSFTKESRRILFALFIQPQLLLPLALNSWKRALKTVVAALLLCALLLTFHHGSRLYRGMIDWAGWFEDRIGQLTIEPHEISWQKPASLPATFWKDSYRVDFVDKEADSDEIKTYQEGRHGVWISPETVYWWSKNRDREIIKRPLWKEGKILNQLKISSLGVEKKVLGEDEIVPLLRRWTWAAGFPALFVGVSFHLTFLYFFYTMIFTAVPFVIRGSLRNYGFKGVHGFYLYVGVPPLLIASIYNLLPLPWLDFNALFLLGFFLFLVFISLQTARSGGSQSGESS